MNNKTSHTFLRSLGCNMFTYGFRENTNFTYLDKGEKER